MKVKTINKAILLWSSNTNLAFSAVLGNSASILKDILPLCALADLQGPPGESYISINISKQMKDQIPLDLSGNVKVLYELGVSTIFLPKTFFFVTQCLAHCSILQRGKQNKLKKELKMLFKCFLISLSNCLE